MDLDAMYEQMAELCEAAGLAIDDTPNGAIHRWVMQNVKHRPDTAFFIVLGIAGAMADRAARREGYSSAGHRAAILAFGHAEAA